MVWAAPATLGTGPLRLGCGGGDCFTPREATLGWPEDQPHPGRRGSLGAGEQEIGLLFGPDLPLAAFYTSSPPSRGTSGGPGGHLQGSLGRQSRRGGRPRMPPPERPWPPLGPALRPCCPLAAGRGGGDMAGWGNLGYPRGGRSKASVERRGSAPVPPAISNQIGVSRRTPRQGVANTGSRAGPYCNQRPSQGSAPDPPANKTGFNAGPPGKSQPVQGSAPDPRQTAENSGRNSFFWQNFPRRTTEARSKWAGLDRHWGGVC